MSVAAGDRRIVSVLVADIVGSTPIAGKLGPERYKFLFDELVRLMREEVERFDGTVAQLTGDGVLALFGAPTAHEDDPKRTVRAALAIREAIDRYGAEVGPAYGIDLQARVAVNTGPVVIPVSDAPAEELYNALGEAVTVAARLQTLGDLIVGPGTADQVAEVFELEELGEVELKGKSETVAAYRVVGVRDRPRTRSEAPLVGREDELETLTAALEGLLEGTGAVVSVSGEPGIGKSRIVAEAKARFQGRVQFLLGHCVPYAESIPYWPVRDLLRGWLGLGVSDPEARVRLELRARLARMLGDDAEEAYPYVAAVLGLTLDPEQEQLLRGFRPRFDSAPDRRLDLPARLTGRPRAAAVPRLRGSLHWSDEATRSLLDELLPAVEEDAIAFLLVHRSDPDHAAWQLVDRAGRRYRSAFHDLSLQALSDDQARALAAADAGGELPEELALLLAERAGGNPFFVGEAVRDLQERGALRRENGGLVLVGDISVPAAVQGALQARLDRLDPDARELITTASVIGHTFGLPLLERVMPQARLRATLSELQWLQLVVEERGGVAPEYRFRHGLVQEVTYGTLVEARRRELHRTVGEALEGIHRDSPEEIWGLLAHHFGEADEPERAVEYLMKAGDAARAVYAQDEAVDLYRQALGFMERTGDQAQARQILLRLGLTHHIAFDFRAANDAFTEAFALPAPAPVQLEPTERISFALTSAWDQELAPGHTWSLPAVQVGCNLFCGLLAIGRDLDIRLELAERFTVSDDGRSYRFVLRSDIRWSDGTPVSAHDFAFSFARMVGDHVVSAHVHEGVSATAVDDLSLEIRLRDPNHCFLYRLGQPWFSPWPRHVYETEGPDWHRQAPLVGNGPFVLTHREADRLVLTAAPYWYGPRGNVDEVTIEIQSHSVAAERWESGRYDVLDRNFSGHAVVGKNAVLEQAPGLGTMYLGLNAGRAPTDDPRVRRAIAHAIDRRGPAEAFRAVPATTGGWIPPGMSGHSHRVAPAFDPDRARSLLAEVGYADPVEIVLAYMDLWEEPSVDVAAQLEAVGCRVRSICATSDPELSALVDEGVHHCFIWGFGVDYPDPASIYDPREQILPHIYGDADLERLLTRIASLHAQDERLRLYREYERVWIGEQAAVVPLSYGDVFLCMRPWVTGLWANGVTQATFAEAVIDAPRESDEVPA